jgi:hypothetical protein
MKPSHKKLYPTCSVGVLRLVRGGEAAITNSGARKASGQTKLWAQPHQEEADLCVSGAAGYTVSLTRANTSEHRSWQLSCGSLVRIQSGSPFPQTKLQAFAALHAG